MKMVMTSAEERNKLIKRRIIIQGLIIQGIILFVLNIFGPNLIHPIILGFPFYLFWTTVLMACIAYINVTIWFKTVARLDREMIRRGEEMWR
jgi:uncharacterized membrane protein